jgi:GDP-D-mannose dehydratase
LFLPSDIKESLGNLAKAKQNLNWTAQLSFEGLVSKMCEAAIADSTAEKKM